MGYQTKGQLILFSFIFGIMFMVSSAISDDEGLDWDKTRNFYSFYLKSELLCLPGVVLPEESEKKILPFMKAHRNFFQGKAVLDIGTGSGIISLYAAKLGAKRVVATDIDKNAILSTERNAKRLSLSSVIEARYVPPEDISAYAVIGPDETFDVIISNPPYSLDLDTMENINTVDKGDLGVSIIKGLKAHLKPDGVAILLYGSLFYHQVMVKFARYLDYEVESYIPESLTFAEEDALFNCYLARLLKYQNMPSRAFNFNWRDEKRDYTHKLEAKRRSWNDFLLAQYPGFIIIKKK
ncbi:MAG: 50S ribosomal protein L11 methyltransferase [Candidatus Omnitrophica bacterium]|nr:50S ribosomal protein L11 methyltransferase [Candidatus Omnitrophota bacterium]